MPGRLAQVSDRIDRHQRRGPAVGVVLAPDPVALEVPLVEAELGQLRGDLVVAVGAFVCSSLESYAPGSGRRPGHGLVRPVRAAGRRAGRRAGVRDRLAERRTRHHCCTRSSDMARMTSIYGPSGYGAAAGRGRRRRRARAGADGAGAARRARAPDAGVGGMRSLLRALARQRAAGRVRPRRDPPAVGAAIPQVQPDRLGTADKVCAAAYAIVDQSRSAAVSPVDETAMVLLELGGAFTAALAIAGGPDRRRRRRILGAARGTRRRRAGRRARVSAGAGAEQAHAVHRRGAGSGRHWRDRRSRGAVVLACACRGLDGAARGRRQGGAGAAGDRCRPGTRSSSPVALARLPELVAALAASLG